jgi:hypothetical protein
MILFDSNGLQLFMIETLPTIQSSERYATSEQYCTSLTIQKIRGMQQQHQQQQQQ